MSGVAAMSPHTVSQRSADAIETRLNECSATRYGWQKYGAATYLSSILTSHGFPQLHRTKSSAQELQRTTIFIPRLACIHKRVL